ncbi:AAA-like domain-containing protein [Nostoc sp. FACHB-110]|uniref:AAA-like domain-containing protein n=1 Tax=Nostoc sp. FACHB-110 TaxID=2692834 RepID=UPI001688B74B|nr:AAA-like domain-containing protein [Nostoc sp. FACHB-110]MBD2440277.1 AAA-like domain-containing protein [Nostoc sp. FACHB-110]
MNTQVKKILILASNPRNSTKLRLDEEIREIDNALKSSKHREQFELKQQWAVRPRDMRKALQDNEPQIVHFSGHGSGEEGLVLEDVTGQAQLVSTEALAGMFELCADQVECVVLNACYSEVQANAIAQYIKYVIGMNQAVGDQAALEFAIGFYDALGAGRSIEYAYKSGCVSIQMAGISEQLTPVLITGKQTTNSLIYSSSAYVESEVRNHKLTTSNSVSTVIHPSEIPLHNNINSSVSDDSQPEINLLDIDDPEGQVPLDSRLYIERPPNETRCYETILKPGALIRIKAPRQMGKSSLMLRILHHAINHNYRAVSLNLQSAGGQVIASLEQFLYWFCARITRKLNLPDQLKDYWQGPMSSNDKCTDYFELFLLENLNCPLLLCLDEVDELFKHPEIANDFFGLLRAWHEEAKINPVWQNLRMVIIHSKEVYIPLNINQSPFNVGVPIELFPFTRTQVMELIQKHGMNWSESKIDQLMELVNGHPYLLRMALYQIIKNGVPLASLTEIAPTEGWLFGEHLRRHLYNLEENPTLISVFKQVLAVNQPLSIKTADAFKLASMGLVRYEGNAVSPLCNLYRRYFQERLGVI